MHALTRARPTILERWHTQTPPSDLAEHAHSASDRPLTTALRRRRIIWRPDWLVGSARARHHLRVTSRAPMGAAIVECQTYSAHARDPTRVSGGGRGRAALIGMSISRRLWSSQSGRGPSAHRSSTCRVRGPRAAAARR
eukprot:3770529-Prymnesium_polylepis.1